MHLPSRLYVAILAQLKLESNRALFAMSTNQPFVMTPTTIAFDTSLPPLARLLWAALEHRCGEHRTCWPGYAALAAKVGCSIRWIPELLRKLVEAGLLIIQPRQGKTNIYRLLGRVERHRATHEVKAAPPRKATNYEQKQPTKTNEIRASRPNSGGIDFSKYTGNGKYAKFTRPIGG
jgi:hypothetical protein